MNSRKKSQQVRPLLFAALLSGFDRSTALTVAGVTTTLSVSAIGIILSFQSPLREWMQHNQTWVIPALGVLLVVSTFVVGYLSAYLIRRSRSSDPLSPAHNIVGSLEGAPMGVDSVEEEPDHLNRIQSNLRDLEDDVTRHTRILRDTRDTIEQEFSSLKRHFRAFEEELMSTAFSDVKDTLIRELRSLQLNVAPQEMDKISEEVAGSLMGSIAQMEQTRMESIEQDINSGFPPSNAR